MIEVDSEVQGKDNVLSKDEVLTVTDVASHLKLGKNNTYKLFQSRVFPSYKIGNQYFIRKEAYEIWFKKLDNKEILI